MCACALCITHHGERLALDKRQGLDVVQLVPAAHHLHHTGPDIVERHAPLSDGTAGTDAHKDTHNVNRLFIEDTPMASRRCSAAAASTGCPQKHLPSTTGCPQKTFFSTIGCPHKTRLFIPAQSSHQSAWTSLRSMRGPKLAEKTNLVPGLAGLLNS
eukprot:1138135-Pelagomonas_calceolata.AAC.4